MLRLGHLRVMLFLAAGLASAATALAQREATESGVKAAFLYKFANYIEWPSNAFGTPASFACARMLLP